MSTSSLPESFIDWSAQFGDHADELCHRLDHIVDHLHPLLDGVSNRQIHAWVGGLNKAGQRHFGILINGAARRPGGVEVSRHLTRCSCLAPWAMLTRGVATLLGERGTEHLTHPLEAVSGFLWAGDTALFHDYCHAMLDGDSNVAVDFGDDRDALVEEFLGCAHPPAHPSAIVVRSLADYVRGA